MNPRTKNVRMVRCELCDYRLSDFHHIRARRRGGRQRDVLPLCPNHHRFANIIQAMVANGHSVEDMQKFGEGIFDEAFSVALPWFILAHGVYSSNSQYQHDALTAHFGDFKMVRDWPAAPSAQSLAVKSSAAFLGALLLSAENQLSVEAGQLGQVAA